MARRSSGYGYNMYDDMYEKMTGGIQTGLGIANAIKQNKVHDEQLKDIETQRREFELDAPVREAKRKEEVASSEKAFTDAKTATQTAYALTLSDIAGKAGESTDPVYRTVDVFNNTLGNISDGKISLNKSLVNPSDPNAGLKIDIMLNGKAINSFNAVDNKQLSAGITATRLAHGMLTPQERTMIDREKTILAETKNIFNALSPEAKRGVKTYEEAMQDPAMAATLRDMVMVNKGTAGYLDDRKDQEMELEQHKSTLATQALARNATTLNMEINRAQDKRSAAQHTAWMEQNKYNIENIRPMEAKIKTLELEGKVAEATKAMSEMIPILIPEFAPVPVETGVGDGDITGLGVSGSTRIKYAHTPEQQKGIATIINLSNAIPGGEKMAPTERINIAYTQLAKLKQQQAEANALKEQQEAQRKKEDNRRRTEEAKRAIDNKKAAANAAKAAQVSARNIDAQNRPSTNGVYPSAATRAGNVIGANHPLVQNLPQPMPSRPLTPEEIEKQRQHEEEMLRRARAGKYLGVRPVVR